MIKDVSETIKKKVKEQRGGFLGMLFGPLGASFLRNLLTGKGVKAKVQEKGLMKEKLEQMKA